MTIRSRRRAKRGYRAEHGYTFVELMMALALLSTAVLGIISMQKMTVLANTHAKDVSAAQRIAQAWSGQLELDGTMWRTGLGGTFLNSTGTWQRPAYIPARKFGAAFDALGNPVSDSVADLAKARYCTQVRMAWLYPPATGRTGNAVLRAEIRVFWQRHDQETIDNLGLCPATQDDALIKKIGFANDVYHFIYQTVAVRQHYQI